MKIEQIIKTSFEHGISLLLKEGKLAVKFKKNHFPEHLKSLIREHRDEIIQHLMDLGLENNEILNTTVKILPRGDLDFIPLSWAQQRLWFIAQLEGDTAAYHISDSVYLEGQLSSDALTHALNTIVKRHEALRTVFNEVNGEVWQKIVPPEEATFNLQYCDLCEVEDQSDRLKKEADAEHQAAFDLAKGPLIRGRLVQLSNHEHVLLVTIHHIVSDRWSMGVLIQEFNTLYEAYRFHDGKGEINPLPPLAIQYADYAVWQRAHLTGDVLAAQKKYWQNHLADIPELLSLPTDYPRPAMPSYCGDTVDITLDLDVSAHVRALALEKGMTVHMVLHAVWVVVLSRLSGQDQIVVGTPVANRQRHEVEGLIGFFVNTLALRVDMTTVKSVESLLAQVKSATLDGYANQDIPFEQVVEFVQPERSLRYTPLFQVMFNFEQDGAEGESDLSLSGLSSDEIDINTNADAQFDLTLSLSDDGKNITGYLEYASDLFNQETVERWSVYFSHLVTELVSNLDTPVPDLSMLPEAERHYLLESVNETQAAYPDTALIHTLFEDQVAANPTRIALVYEEQSMTYGVLNERANQLAYHLMELGVKPDTLVGLCIERSVEMIIAVLGILKAGGAYVPLDPSYPKARLLYQIKDTSLNVILTQESLHDELLAQNLEGSVQTVCLDADAVKKQLKTYSNLNPSPEEQNLNSRNLAYVIYTSGTTGQPKGVMIEHRSLCNLTVVQRKRFHLSSAFHVLQFASIAFDGATWEMFMALAQGGTLVMPNQAQVKSPDALSELVEQHQVTHAALPPALLPLLDVKRWTGVKTLVVAGEACAKNLAVLWSQDRQFVNSYGPSEFTVCATEGVFNPSQSILHIGKPNQNTQAYVCDKNGTLLPQGVPGELLIGGVSLARGYLNQPELTAEKFITNPFYDAENPASSERLYKTGDLVRWLPDGNLEFLGRIDHQVKLRGFRIELGEIEAQLLNQTMVRDTVVLLDKNGGEGRLVAYVTVNAGSELDREQLRQVLSESLPEYMVPEIYIELEALPLTSNGKVDRKALPKPEDHHLGHAEYEPPQGLTEIVLAEIWQELLHVEQVSRHDNFFRLGGHSLLIIRLIAELQAKDLHAEVRTIFDTPVLKDLAAVIGKGSQSYFEAPANLIPKDCMEITPDLLPLVDLEQSHIDSIIHQIPGGAANIQDIYPLGPLQEGILFHHLMSSKEQGDTYIMPILLLVPDEQNADRFIQALNMTIARNDVLRTAVFWDDLPRPVQVVLRESPIVVNTLTLDTSQDTLTQLREYMAPDRLWMDLTEAPLLRLQIAADPHSDEVFMLICQHHIINDHIGLDILIDEVNAYLRTEDGSNTEVLDLPVQTPYRKFIAHTLMLSETGASQAYFESKLGDVNEPTLPFGLQDTQIDAAKINEFDYVFENTFSVGLKEACSQLDISIASVFHLAWALVLGRCSGRDDVVFGTVLSGRLQGTQGADRSIGLFINTLPLRLKFAGNVKKALKQTHDELLGLLEHEQASLTLVHDCTDLSGEAPLITTLLNYRRDEPEAVAESLLPESGVTDEGPEVTMLDSYERTNYPLTLCVDDLGGEQFSLSLQAVAEIDGERVIGYMRTAMESLITAVSENDRSIKDIVILPKAERQQLLVELNQTQVDYPDAALIHTLFEEQVAINPEGIALVYEGESLTYQALNQRSNQLAHYLLDEGVKPDTLVGLCIERSVEMIIGVLGILKAGGAYVPLDPTYPEARLAYQIEDADLNIIITQASLQALLIHPTKSVHAVCLDTQEMYRCLEKCSKHNPSLSGVGLHAQRLAYVIYTSGTTGNPKGVMIEHRSLCNLTVMQKESFNLSSACHVLQFASIAFDAATWEMFMALAQGGTLVMPSSTEVKSPEALSALVEGHQITHATLPPSLLPLLDIERWAGVKTLIVAGEACAKQLAIAWSRDRQFVNAYGPSEFTVCATAGAFSPSQSILHMGKPNQNTQVYVCNDDGALLPQGVPGELLLGGIGLARGYLNRPELTAEKFITNPFYDASNPASSERLYRTGDLVRWLADGNLEFLGRIDHQVKLRGFRIELGEIEAQLLNQAEIHEAVVVLDKTADRLVAYVVANDEVKIDNNLLRQALSDALPEYMVPSVYIELEALPLTSNGKVNRKALPKPESHHLSRAEYEAPQGATEVALAEIWQTLLKVEQVSRHDNFFSLGGNSLLAITLINAIKVKLNFQMPLRFLFDANDLRQIAQYIDTLSINENDSREVFKL
ncbi:amino acid adenylation domain-containing protein [Marinicella sp. W31]|uniref:amino acid adenylation domain-containing protein n=1 Tax=Marinicella sp. W31 TaxID=3023713 RepID=UPI00375711F5